MRNGTPRQLFLEAVVMATVLVLAAATFGCNRAPRAKTYSIAPEFTSLLASFTSDATSQQVALGVVDDLVMKFTDRFDGTTVIGACSQGLFSTPVVSINHTAWLHMSTLGQEQLIYHELGHCLLHRHHDDTYLLVSGCLIPRTIMNSYQFADSVYQDNRAYYIHELFHP